MRNTVKPVLVTTCTNTQKKYLNTTKYNVFDPQVLCTNE